uniref:Uncharacterized protein n=1 Tax=Micrurus spixii TaxID=129469 RepID=A0A2D4MKF5_9SAUR
MDQNVSELNILISNGRKVVFSQEACLTVLLPPCLFPADLERICYVTVFQELIFVFNQGSKVVLHCVGWVRRQLSCEDVFLCSELQWFQLCSSETMCLLRKKKKSCILLACAFVLFIFLFETAKVHLQEECVCL